MAPLRTSLEVGVLEGAAARVSSEQSVAHHGDGRQRPPARRRSRLQAVSVTRAPPPSPRGLPSQRSSMISSASTGSVPRASSHRRTRRAPDPTERLDRVGPPRSGLVDAGSALDHRAPRPRAAHGWRAPRSRHPGRARCTSWTGSPRAVPDPSPDEPARRARAREARGRGPARSRPAAGTPWRGGRSAGGRRRAARPDRAPARRQHRGRSPA